MSTAPFYFKSYFVLGDTGYWKLVFGCTVLGIALAHCWYLEKSFNCCLYYGVLGFVHRVLRLGLVCDTVTRCWVTRCFSSVGNFLLLRFLRTGWPDTTGPPPQQTSCTIHSGWSWSVLGFQDLLSHSSKVNWEHAMESTHCSQ